MASTRYEVRVNSRLSERARGAFWAMEVMLIPAQTILSGNLPKASDLGELLARCSAMGLEVVSVRRLPSEVETTPGMSA
jgi:hypothetical protein